MSSYDQNLAGTGPMFIPEEDKDPNFIYRFINLDPRKQFRFERNLRNGYVLVTKDEMPNLQNNIVNLPGGSMSNEGDYIVRVVGENLKAYLAKIPRELYEAREKQRDERIKEQDKLLEEQYKSQYGLSGNIRRHYD